MLYQGPTKCGLFAQDRLLLQGQENCFALLRAVPELPGSEIPGLREAAYSTITRDHSLSELTIIAVLSLTLPEKIAAERITQVTRRFHAADAGNAGAGDA